MDDFYSGGKPVGSSSANDDFFAGGPSGRSQDNDFYSSSAPKTSQSSNPFDAPAVSFDMEDQRRNDDFFSESTVPGGATGFEGGGGGASGSGGVQSVTRREGDDRYPWQMGFWMNMFDVDTREVLMRLLNSLVPFRRAFVDGVKAKPDLWAPFWICSTLIFFMTWTGNFAAYLNSVINNLPYEPQVQKLPWGAMAIYGYWLVIPLVFWAIFRYKEVPITLLMCYCIFGYSLFIYVPMSVIAIAALGPIVWLAWLLIMLACAYSTLILMLSFFYLVYDASFKPGYIMILVMGALSVGLGLSFKLYFFRFDAPPPVAVNTTGTIF